MVDNIGKVGSISLITSMKIMEKRLVEGKVHYKTMIASLVLVSINVLKFIGIQLSIEFYLTYCEIPQPSTQYCLK